jgi:hypothetical protein
MSGRIIYVPPDPAPPTTHSCEPPILDATGGVGWVEEVSTVWECECGKTYVLKDMRCGVAWSKEGLFERLMRERHTQPRPSDKRSGYV